MRGHHAAHGGSNMLETFDTNGDGQLTQAEINSFRSERHAKFDADGNGTLSLQEYEALWLDAYRERMVDEFQRHDDDGNGLVTTEEFNDPFANMVTRMDRNDDGILSGEELRPKRHRDISDRRGSRHDRHKRDTKDE
jgi:Ca2+-binding EF-hand superfamily protein